MYPLKVCGPPFLLFHPPLKNREIQAGNKKIGFNLNEIKKGFQIWKKRAKVKRLTFRPYLNPLGTQREYNP
jgi:hypothetical protein